MRSAYLYEAVSFLAGMRRIRRPIDRMSGSGFFATGGGDSCRGECGNCLRIGLAGEAGEEFAQVGLDGDAVSPTVFHEGVDCRGVVSGIF